MGTPEFLHSKTSAASIWLTRNEKTERPTTTISESFANNVINVAEG